MGVDELCSKRCSLYMNNRYLHFTHSPSSFPSVILLGFLQIKMIKRNYISYFYHSSFISPQISREIRNIYKKSRDNLQVVMFFVEFINHQLPFLSTMELVSTTITATTFTTHLQFGFQAITRVGSNSNHLFRRRKKSIFPTNLQKNFGFVVKSFASRNYAKKSSKKSGEFRRNRIKESSRISPDEYSEKEVESSSSEDLIAETPEVFLNNDLSAKKSISSTSRSVVLQACTVTSGLILALGLVVRQVSHFAFTEGLPVVDCSTEVSFKFEAWHLELIIGLVIVISSCRYLLLQTWSDFAESSEAANQQVLSSLQPADYLIVAFLPGISEELLFRGALLPLFGLNWKSALVAATVFGALHLGSGRKYSFAIWATFVGLAYGYATIVTSSIIVPITSHALNNLIGGILWRSMSITSEKR